MIDLENLQPDHRPRVDLVVVNNGMVVHRISKCVDPSRIDPSIVGDGRLVQLPPHVRVDDIKPGCTEQQLDDLLTPKTSRAEMDDMHELVKKLVDKGVLSKADLPASMREESR